MKKIVIPVLLAAVLVGAELVVGGFLAPGAGASDLWRDEGRLQVLRSDQAAWVGGASWSTDGSGHRRQWDVRREQDSSLRVLVLGGEFTAGAGLEDEDLYTNVLESYLREFTSHRDAVVLQASARGPVVARTRWYASLAQDLQPDRVIIQVEAQDPAEVVPFAFAKEPVTAVSAPQESSIALVRWWQRRRAARQRTAAEERVQEFVERHGWAGQVIRQARDRTVRIQRVLNAKGRLSDADREYLQGLVRVEVGQDRQERAVEDRRAWTTLLDQLLSQGARVAVLFTGPGYLYRLERDAFQDLALEAVYTPVLERVPELWVQGRPAALVHELTARSLVARLGGTGFLGPEVSAPEEWLADARSLEVLQDRILGHDREVERQARDSLEPVLDFTGDRVPWNVIRGLRPGGVVPPGEVVELLCFPGYLSEELVVVAELPVGGPAPRLSISFARIEERAGGEGVVQDLGNGRQRITWRVPDPGVIFRTLRLPVELVFSSEEGSLDLRLQRIEWIQQDG